MRILPSLQTFALLAIFFVCRANSASAAINAGAKVSLYTSATYNSAPPQTQLGSNAAVASDSSSGQSTWYNVLTSTGSASAGGGTTQSFLKAQVDLADSFYGPFDNGEPSNTGYAEAAWQD